MPRYELIVSGEFSAAHQLCMYDGGLEPLHGHNWKVELAVSGPRLDRIGVLADFTQVRAVLCEALSQLHDRFLNELSQFADRNPSTENVAAFILEAARARLDSASVRVAYVRVWETSDASATAYADDAA